MEAEDELGVTEAGRRGEGDASPTVNGIMIFLLLGCWYCASISSLSLGTVLRFSSSSLNMIWHLVLLN